MAKLKAPLLSLAASGSLADTLTFTRWKGLHVAKAWAPPTDPNTTRQQTHRARMRTIVSNIHAAQADPVSPLEPADLRAYDLLASLRPTPRTWYNELIKQSTDQYVATLKPAIFAFGSTFAMAGSLMISLDWHLWEGDAITAANWHYGTSPTAMIHTLPATIFFNNATDLILGLASGVKYFLQLRPSLHANYLGVRSGIYYDYPT